MAVNKRKKNSRQRGSHTHGWGAMKKHRGHGNRGGAGKAGSGKRADSKKTSLWKNKKYFGKYGFTRPNKTSRQSVTVSHIENKLEQLVAKKLAKSEAGTYSVNLSDLGFAKLLSKGKTSKKMIVTCNSASEKAIKSVEAAGGKVILPKEGETTNGPEGNTPESA